ncbi:MAG TPA: hypothetical protein VM689_26390 [Aliidongia sp.]|nr:hypothetical protein [Aliidongia sp.]
MEKLPAGNTLFEFAHAVFRTPDARFLLGTDRKPCLAIKLGDLDALVPLSSVVKEFQLEGSPDAALIETVIAGLKYVKVIRPGDSIPRELLDGTASWRVEESHLEVAQGRLTLQLNSWLSGQERVVTDAVEILQLVDDPSVVARVKAGYGKVAAAIRLDASKEAEVIARIDKLAREIVYVEALRDRFNSVRQLQGKVASLRRVYRTDKTIDEELIRINNLFLKPIDAFEKVFADGDAQSKSIIYTLGNLEAQIGQIRDARDRLHAQLMLWDEILVQWQNVQMEISVATEKTIKDLYRFLAQTYLTQKSW